VAALELEVLTDRFVQHSHRALEPSERA
jgi:hypothetical protein